jgi:hypothetical protein
MRLKLAGLLFGAAALAGAAASAQPQGPAPGPRRPLNLNDPQQLSTYRGVVEQFTLTTRGDIDGFILTDGTEVDTPPRLSTQIAYAVQPGDWVTIHGLHAAALPLVKAVSIIDDENGRMVVDNGPPAPPPPNGQDLDQLEGHVRMTLHGPQGEVNGALMENGVVLRLPPPEVSHFADLLQPGQMLVARGVRTATALGAVFDADEIGQSETQLSTVEPGGPGRRRPPPPPPGAGAPPEGHPYPPAGPL